MKILIISANQELEPYPVAPIGAAYIAAALKKEGHEAAILDLCFEQAPEEAIQNEISRFSPDVVGLSIRNADNLTFGKSIFYMPYLQRITHAIRRMTSAPAIAGGSGFSIFPEAALRFLGIDYGIVGAGDEAVVLFANALENGKDLASVPNFCMIRDDRFIMNPVRYGLSFGSPDRSFLDNRRYMQLGGMGNIQAKRGCPFKCTYCTYPALEGDQLLMRPPDEVAAEMKEAAERYGIDYLFFVDDIFNFPQEYAAAVCDSIIKSGVRMDWTCFATPLGMTRDLAGLMKAAGCKAVEFGSDAGACKTLEAFGKPFSSEEIANAAECCRSVDLPNAHYIIMGGPGEDSSTISETFRLFDSIRPSAAIALIGVRIYPDTPLRLRAVEEGVISESSNLFEPEFYLTREIEPEMLMRTVTDKASARPNWIVPSLGIRCNTEVMSTLRKLGRKGPLWDLLA